MKKKRKRMDSMILQITILIVAYIIIGAWWYKIAVGRSFINTDSFGYAWIALIWPLTLAIAIVMVVMYYITKLAIAIISWHVDTLPDIGKSK